MSMASDTVAIKLELRKQTVILEALLLELKKITTIEDEDDPVVGIEVELEPPTSD